MDRVHRTCRLLMLLALAAVLLSVGFHAVSAQTPPTVWIQRGSGTGSGVDPTGSYACGTSKVFYIWLDNTQVTPPTTWNGTYYVVTFPKNFSRRPVI